jgi:hypothetical protein
MSMNLQSILNFEKEVFGNLGPSKTEYIVQYSHVLVECWTLPPDLIGESVGFVYSLKPVFQFYVCLN